MSKIDLNNVPKHIAIIMDGNGRWAKNRSKSRNIGHKAGVDSLRRAVKYLVEGAAVAVAAYYIPRKKICPIKPKNQVG